MIEQIIQRCQPQSFLLSNVKIHAHNVRIKRDNDAKGKKIWFVDQNYAHEPVGNAEFQVLPQRV